MLAGLEQPSEGSVARRGAAVEGLGRTELAELRRREVALVTQEPGLIPYLSALENVGSGCACGTATHPTPAVRRPRSRRSAWASG